MTAQPVVVATKRPAAAAVDEDEVITPALAKRHQQIVEDSKNAADRLMPLVEDLRDKIISDIANIAKWSADMQTAIDQLAVRQHQAIKVWHEATSKASEFVCKADIKSLYLQADNAEDLLTKVKEITRFADQLDAVQKPSEKIELMPKLEARIVSIEQQYSEINHYSVPPKPVMHYTRDDNLTILSGTVDRLLTTKKLWAPDATLLVPKRLIDKATAFATKYPHTVVWNLMPDRHVIVCDNSHKTIKFLDMDVPGVNMAPIVKFKTINVDHIYNVSVTTDPNTGNHLFYLEVQHNRTLLFDHTFKPIESTSTDFIFPSGTTAHALNQHTKPPSVTIMPYGNFPLYREDDSRLSIGENTPNLPISFDTMAVSGVLNHPVLTFVDTVSQMLTVIEFDQRRVITWPIMLSDVAAATVTPDRKHLLVFRDPKHGKFLSVYSTTGDKECVLQFETPEYLSSKNKSNKVTRAWFLNPTTFVFETGTQIVIC